jgi:hypothetical protein
MDNIYYTIAEQKMEKLSYLLNEMPKEDLKRVMARELQKIKLIPLDMFSAKDAISNIIYAEIGRKTINFNRTMASLMSLNLSNVTTRSKFRFDNYYRRFYVSRNRGFDFEGMIAGFLDGNISENKSSPFDVDTKGNKISLKTLNNETESVVVKSISTSLKTYYNTYNGSPENKEELLNIFNSENPIKELVNSENNDMVNIAEDVIRLSLEGIDSLLIGIPKENNRVDLYYFTKERLVYLSTLKGVIMAPKTKGSKQLRLSSNILPEADMTGSIIFPNMTDEDYEAFLIGDDTTKATIDVLNKFGGKYGVKDLGGQLPQDIVMGLAKSQQFITDMGFILGNENKE